MDVREATQQITLSQWTALVQDQKNSGQTVRNWCTENGISEGQFYYYQSRVRQKLLEQVDLPARPKETGFVRLALERVSTRQPATVAQVPTVAIVDEPTTQAATPLNAVHLCFRGSTLDIPAGTKADDLREILRALASV